MISTFVISGLLGLVAIGTFVWQLLAWREQQHQSPPAEIEFYRGRHQRRTQISFLLGVVAVAMVGGMWIVNPLVVGFYWLGVLGLLVWVILLAMVDASSSHAFFTSVRVRQLADQVHWHKQHAPPRRPDSQEPEA